MNEKWTNLIHLIGILVPVFILIIALFEKSRKWAFDFLHKIFFKKKIESCFEKYRLRGIIEKSQERLAEIEGTIKPHTPMSDNTRNIIIACIISFGMIISTVIYAYSTRYVIKTTNPAARIDKWTGKYEYLKKED